MIIVKFWISAQQAHIWGTSGLQNCKVLGGKFARKNICKTRSSSNMFKNALLSASGWNPKLHNYHPPLFRGITIDFIFKIEWVIASLNSVKNTNFGLDNKKLFLMHWKITFADPSLKIRLSFEGTPTSSSPGVSAERSREGFSRTQWGWVPHLPTDYCVHSFDSELV